MVKLKKEEKIEYIKRQLRDYGYYTREHTRLIKNAVRIAEEIKINMSPSSACGRESSGSSRVTPYLNELQYEEATTILEARNVLKKRDALNISHYTKFLLEDEMKIVTKIFFENKTYRQAEDELNYSISSISEKVKLIVIKMLNNQGG